MKPLYLFSLCLLFLAVACKKNKADPQPELTGRWEGNFTLRIGYNPSGQVVSRDTLPADGIYLVISQNSFSYYLKSTGANITTIPYTRQGNTIQYDRASATITELTDHKLTIRQADINKSPGLYYRDEDSHYTR